MSGTPEYIPYIYEIVYKPTLQRYIGVRYAEEIKGKLPEEDLGFTYFSSSKHPLLDKGYQKNNKHSFEYNVLVCFPNDYQSAREHEEEIHREYKVDENDEFLNATIANQKSGFNRKTSLMGAHTRKTTITKDGLMLSEKIAREAAETKKKKNEQGVSLQEIINEKLSQKFKGKRSGENNANSKSYRIYKNDGVLFCEIPLSENMEDFLRKNGLPYSFKNSQLQGGKPILNEQMSCHLSMDIHKHLLPYMGWYCVSVNKDGSENYFYERKETPRYLMVDKNSNVVEVFTRNKTLKREVKERGWPMNAILKSYRNGGQPLFYDSRKEEVTKQEKMGTRWLKDYCFVKMEKDGNFYHHWAKENKLINIGE